MRVSDLAKELNVESSEILSVLKSLKLKAKGEKQELSSTVIAVIKRQIEKKPSKAKAVKKEEKLKERPKDEKKTKKAAAKSVTKKKATKKTTAKKAKKTERKPTVKKRPLKKTKVVKKVPKRKAEEKKTKAPLPVSRVVKHKTPEKEKPIKEAIAPKKEEAVTEKPLAAEAKPQEEKSLKELEIQLPITVKDLAVRLQQKPSVLLKKLVEAGILAHINQNLGEDIVKKLAAEFGFSIKQIKTQEEQLIESHEVRQEDTHLLKPRAPVITLMGHVDHGKTSLLDKIRKSNITDKEHGGITQHISAYSVTLPKGKITFLDTPGHEAFTAMRARGANITDLVIVVVAADEGIMPQTEEAIDHARAADVPIVVAINKIDKRNADIDRVKKQLDNHNLKPEDWGGKTIVVGVSAVTGEGIDTLLEMILLEAELLELKANYEKMASGIVVEAHLHKGKGSVATIIVQNGTLREGDIVVIGPNYGKVKAMFDDHQRPIKEAGPATPAEILGLSGVPEAGSLFYAIDDEKQARNITFKRQQELQDKKLQSSKITLEDLYSQIQEGNIKELSLIIKADVRGSLEAIKDSLSKLPTEEVKIKFIHMGVGEVNASDIILASASNAIVIAFNVGVGISASAELAKNSVDVRTYRIIYDAINDIKNALSGMLEPKTKKNFLGRVEIREVFKLSRSGIVAGCYVSKGKIHRKANIDIIRNGQSVFSGTISSLKRFKDDVREVAEGYECGITIHGYTSIEKGDIIEAYEIEKIARTL